MGLPREHIVELGLVNYPGYTIDDQGIPRSYRGKNGNPLGMVMKIGTNPKGYAIVSLRNRAGKQCQRRVHMLVLEAFIRPCPPGMQSRHFPDNNKSNNALTNLAYGTRKENERDKILHGTHVQGTAIWSAQLTDPDIPIILARHTAGETGVAIAKDFNVSNDTIYAILDGRTWKHIPR